MSAQMNINDENDEKGKRKQPEPSSSPAVPKPVLDQAVTDVVGSAAPALPLKKRKTMVPAAKGPRIVVRATVVDSEKKTDHPSAAPSPHSAVVVTTEAQDDESTSSNKRKRKPGVTEINKNGVTLISAAAAAAAASSSTAPPAVGVGVGVGAPVIVPSPVVPSAVTAVAASAAGKKRGRKQRAEINYTDRKFPCKQCGKRFEHKHQLEKHVEIHDEAKMNFACPECPKRFLVEYRLKKHMRTHTGEKPFQCVECGMKFAHSGAVTLHRRVHTGDRPFVCDVGDCNKRFMKSSNLARHRRTHTGDRPFKCSYDGCNKSFVTSGHLKQHSRLHSGDKPYKCKHCGRFFSQTAILRKHMLTHEESPDRQFKCEACGMRFTRENVLNRHKAWDCTKVEQHEDRVHVCQVPGCGKSFGHKSSLPRHMKMMHPDVDIRDMGGLAPTGPLSSVAMGPGAVAAGAGPAMTALTNSMRPASVAMVGPKVIAPKPVISTSANAATTSKPTLTVINNKPVAVTASTFKSSHASPP